MKTISPKVRQMFLFATAAVLLVVGMGISAVAQSRGAGRGPGAGGGARPVPTIVRPTRDIVVVPGARRGPVADLPNPSTRVRRMPEVDRGREERERRDPDRDWDRRDDERDDERRRRQDDNGNRFQKFARWLGVSPERLQNFYQEAKAANPDLRLGQFFSAIVIANRLHGSNPNVTPQAILRGLDSGMSLERTLVALGLSGDEAKAAVKWAERLVKHLKP